MQDFLLGRGNVDMCIGGMHVSVHSLGFYRFACIKFWTYLMARNVRFTYKTDYNYIVMVNFVIVVYRPF